jgi:HEAT repeat protein
VLNETNEQRKHIRVSAAEALGNIGDERALPALIANLADLSHTIRKAAEQALIKISKAAVEPLIVAMRQPNNLIRQHAAAALGEIGDARAIEPLLYFMRDPDRDVSFWAAYALGQIGEPMAIFSLNAALRDANDSIRALAANALVKIGAPAVKPLLIALRDSDRFVRWHAARALGQIGDPRALSELEEVAQNDKGKTLHGRVADAAREAANRIRLNQMMMPRPS